MLISFSDDQMRSIFAGATAQVPYEDRARYLVLIADALDVDDTEIGDGRRAALLPMRCARSGGIPAPQ